MSEARRAMDKEWAIRSQAPLKRGEGSETTQSNLLFAPPTWEGFTMKKWARVLELGL